MEPKTLENLEFTKVLDLIAGFAGSVAAKDQINGLEPLSDRQVIEERLSELDELFAFFDHGGHMSVGGIREIRDLLEKMVSLGGGAMGQSLAGPDFLRVRANIDVFLGMKKSFTQAYGDSKNPGAPRGKDGILSGRFSPVRLLGRIDRCPDFTRERDRIIQSISEQGEVRDDATPRLSGIRRELSKVRQELEKRLGEFLHSSSDIFQDRFFTLRNDRYCVPVKASSQSQVQGIVHDQSGSGQTVFVEPLEFLGSNNRIARLKSEEREEILRILRELTEMLATRKDDLTHLFDTLVFFDALNAKMRFCRKYQAFRPEIVPAGHFELIEARHPLLYPDCVPLTVTLNREHGCVIITGPNGGGKTVALKTIGNNCLLLQIGCYVLAKGISKMPIFDEVLADIGESQSIENHLSTFTAHITRITEMFNRSGRSALVLIDEIGVGTDPVEGSAMAVAVLKALLRRGALSVVTSHYDSLKQAAFQIPGFENAAMEFDYETFKPTFRFVQGIAGRSNALLVSRTFGLPDEILQEMTNLLEGHGGEEGRLLEALERERSKAEKLRQAWEEKNRTLAFKMKEQQALMSRLEKFRATRKDELIETFEESLKKKLRDIELVIHGFRERLTSGATGEDQVEEARKAHAQTQATLSELRARSAAIPPVLAPQPGRKLKPGDIVVWMGGTSQGIIETLDEDQVRAQVDFDGKSLNVAVKELTVVESEEPETRRKTPESRAIAPAPFFRSEIDLRGMRVEEAVEKAESFLKLANAGRVGKAFLIHGKGTGALQRGIHEFLKRSPYRDKFRFGRYGEGDLGVTVVVFDPAADVETSQLPDEKGTPGKKRRFRKAGK